MAEQHERITIDDVARQAGVSIATVSRVVNGRYGVASGTMTRVQEVIGDLGYEPSIAARSLRSQQTNVIGILVADIEPFSAEFLKGAAKGIRESKYELVVYSVGHQAEEGWERRSLSRLSGTLTDGTILVTPTVVDVAHRQPVVAVDPHVGRSSLPTVHSENYEGALSATNYLIGLGHRRIGFLGGRPDLESARRREAGYHAALSAAGIPVDPALMKVGGYTEKAAEKPAGELLSLADPPTAIFAANDLSASQMMRTAVEMGFQIPRDLSVVGFDNIPESALTIPPLTTVDQSIQGLGYEAVKLLIDLLANPERMSNSADSPIRITLPTKLVVRQSCSEPLAS